MCELRQFSDEEFEIILTGVTLAQLRSMGSLVPKSQYLDTRIKNAFYDIQDSQLGRDYDLMILDGPSGNGRSVAFGVMKERMKRPGFILIDDFNHYQFLYDCSRCFRFNVMLGEILPSKRWVLLEVK